MQRVLLANKFFYRGAGAETAFFRTRELLQRNGHEVVDFAIQDPRNEPSPWSSYFAASRSYDAGQPPHRKVADGLATIWSPGARRAIRRLVTETRPDVAHLHNVYHQLTLSVVEELAAQGVPVVMTLHDYKPVCPNYELYTNGEPCRRCVGSHPLHAVRHRCLKGSLGPSAIAAVEALVVRARRSYGRVDTFISPSRFLAEIMVDGGIAPERVQVLPNFVDDEQMTTPPRKVAANGTPYFLFLGRLEEVKGVRVLLEVMKLPADFELRVAGGGPLEGEVRAAESGAVRYLGRLDWPALAQQLDGARALVLPAIWEENNPMVILEARARGCPVIVSDRGGLPDMVRHDLDGLVVPAGDVTALSRAMVQLAHDDRKRMSMAAAGEERLACENTASVHLQGLLEIYEGAARRRGAKLAIAE